jgi:hypothetical protein
MTPESKIIRTGIADVWMDSEQITHMHFKPTERHDLEDAQEVVKAHNSLTNGVKTPVLADLRNVTTGANRQARKYYCLEESCKSKLGMAMLVQSPVQRMLGNLFVKINKPPYPTRLFLDEKEALIWLRAIPHE